MRDTALFRHKSSLEYFLAAALALLLSVAASADDRVSPTADFTVRGGVYDRISSGETTLPISITAATTKDRNIRLDIGKNKGGETRSGVVLLLREHQPGLKTLVAYEGKEAEIAAGKASVFYWERTPTAHRPLSQPAGTLEVTEDDRSTGTLVFVNVTFTDSKGNKVKVFGTARLPPERHMAK